MGGEAKVLNIASKVSSGGEGQRVELSSAKEGS